MDKYINQIRQLLFGQCVVALDTNVLSELEEGTPEWFDGFVKMREKGVKFVIPDLCIGERLNSYERAAANYLEDMKLKWHTMVSQLDKIIWKDLPCLPLRGELYDLVGIKERDKEEPYVRERPLSVGRSKELYRFFHNYASSPYNRKGQRDLCIEEFKKVRREWKEWILDWREKAQGKTLKAMCRDQIEELAAEFEAPVEISRLFELPVRIAAEYAHDKNYKPTVDSDIICFPLGKKKPKNDALDYAILFLTMASINICSCDKFFKKVQKLNLTASHCCYSPQKLYDEWRNCYKKRKKHGLPCVSFPVAMLE